MSLTDILLLSIALGIDCLVVSFSQGLVLIENRKKYSIMLALAMGLGQGLMPCIGYLGTHCVKTYLLPFSKLIVFAIFLTLGLKFIFEALSNRAKNDICCLEFRCIFAMAIATSIDALVAGSSLSITDTALLLPAILIGITSFIMSLMGFWSGNLFKKFPPKYLEIFGGSILIILAFRSLYF